MALCFLCPIYVLFFYSILVKASFTLSPEVTKFIPGCAQLCFESFLDANYDEKKGGAAPSLQFLCSTNSTSGNTVGEGAISCILSEDKVKFCNGKDAKEEVVVKAFQMCNGQPNALPNTQSTITATVALGTSGVVIIAQATTSIRLASSSSSSTTTSSRTTSTIATRTSSTSRTTTTTTSSATSSAASSATPPPTTQDTSDNAQLSKGQIVGIAGGAVGGVGSVIAVLAILVCLRKRKLSRRDSDALSDTLGQDGPGWWQSSSTPPQVPLRFDISPPNMFSRRSIIIPGNIGLAVSPDQPDPLTVKRSSKLLPEKPTLRLVTPTESPSPDQGQISKQPMTSAQGGGIRPEDGFRPSNGQVGTSSSEPVSNITAATGAAPPIPSYHPARQPPPGIALPHDGNNHSQSASQNSNIDRDFAPGPEFDIKPLNVGRPSLSSFSRPRTKEQEPSQLGRLEIPNNFRPVTQSSSLYSQPTPRSAGPPFYNAPGNRYPSLTSSDANAQGYGRRPGSYKQTGPSDRASEGSFTSFESEDVAQGNKRLSVGIPSGGIRKSGIELSPVAGSPASGKSPVSYPKIPAPVRLTTKIMRTVPPPAQPNFGSVFSSQFSPTEDLSKKPWRAAEIAAQNQRNQMREEWRLSRGTSLSPQFPRLDLLPAAQIREMRNGQQPGPAYTMDHSTRQAQYNRTDPLLSLPSQLQIRPQMQPPMQSQYHPHHMQQQWQPQLQSQPQQQYYPQRQLQPQRQQQQQPRYYPQQQLQPQRQMQSQMQPQYRPQQYLQPQPQRQPQRQPQPQPQPQWQPQRQSQLQPQPQQQYNPQPQLQPLPLRQTPTWGPGVFLREHSRTNSSTSANSTSSSLLSKRIGVDKAAALHLASKGDAGDKAKTKWRVLKRDEIEAAKDPGWRPQLLLQAQGGGAQDNRSNSTPNTDNGDATVENGGGVLSSKSVRFDMIADDDGARPPVTPGWVPKLTPTRRGNELFLSVQ